MYFKRAGICTVRNIYLYMYMGRFYTMDYPSCVSLSIRTVASHIREALVSLHSAVFGRVRCLRVVCKAVEPSLESSHSKEKFD